MNYKYLIALFGGEELDAWEPPKSEWMLINEGEKWTAEFCQLKGISEQSAYSFKGYVWFPDDKSVQIRLTDPVRIHPSSQFIIYCNQQDQIIYIPRRFKASTSVIEKIESLLDAGLLKEDERYQIDEL